MQLHDVVLVLALMVGVASAQQFRTDSASSSCSQLESRLKPLHSLKFTQLQGQWVTVTKGSFGYLDSSSESEYIVDSTSRAPLRTVPDCILHNVSASALSHSLTVATQYFFEEPALNTVMSATYSVMPNRQGIWAVINSTETTEQAVTFLVLAASPSSHIVLATCRQQQRIDDNDYETEEEEDVTTVVHILAREGVKLKPEIQRDLMGKTAHLLNRSKFLAAELSTTCVSPKHSPKHPVSSSAVILDLNTFFTLLILIIVHVI